MLYEEQLDGGILNEAISYITKAEVLIVGGTSLAVYPAANLIHYYGGDRLILINKSETPYDKKANIVIHDSVGKVLGNVIQDI